MDLQSLENMLQAQQLLANGFSTSSLSINQNMPLDLTLMLRNNLQQQYLKAQFLQLMEFKNRLLQQTLNKVPVHPQVQLPNILRNSLSLKALPQLSSDFC